MSIYVGIASIHLLLPVLLCYATYLTGTAVQRLAIPTSLSTLILKKECAIRGGVDLERVRRAEEIEWHGVLR